MDVLKKIWALISESSGYISILFIKIIASKGGKTADYLPNFGIFKFVMVGVRFNAGFFGMRISKTSHCGLYSMLPHNSFLYLFAGNEDSLEKETQEERRYIR